mgnify:CR=1 FL=1
MGVTKGVKVLIYAENSVEWFCTALALLRLNAITVTLLAILSKSFETYKSYIMKSFSIYR